MNEGDGPEADEEDADASLGGCDLLSLHFHEIFSFQDDASLAGERDQRLVPLRRDTTGVRPVLYGALPSSEEVGESALAAEAPDDPLCRVGEILLGYHASELNEIFVGQSSCEPREPGRLGHHDYQTQDLSSRSS